MKNAHINKYKKYMLRAYFGERISVVNQLDNKEKQTLLELEKTIDEESKNKVKENIRNMVNNHKILYDNVKKFQ
ncbi:hypothetical protein [Staphylococcus hominis]|uniref:hypothetical protein n=1 Tax=Staphylococcus hominis TaxID=1290 RepID=UPI00090F2129|nr:hypothetical protein [Staphylococcus hominis]SFX84897.1 hypothetical protein SAMN04487789_1472 [Staphylococcus hominis]